MKLIKSLTLNTAIVAATIFGGLAGVAHAAGNASISMTGGSHSAGSSFAVPIYVSSADPVNVIQADFSYDASQLRFQGVSCGGAFGITAGASANSVTCGSSVTGGVSGSQLVAIVNFKALSGSGSSIVGIAPSSHVYSATDNSDIWNGVPNSTGISFFTPAPVAAAPATPAAEAPVVKKAVKHVAAPTTPVKAPSNAVSWLVVVASSFAALALIVAAVWASRHPKQYKSYKKASKRFVNNNVGKPGKRIFKQGLQLIPFNK